MIDAMNSGGATASTWSAWLRRHRSEVLDLAALAMSLVLARAFRAGMPASAILCALVVAALVPLRPATSTPTLWSEFWSALPRRIVTVIAVGALLGFVLNRSLAGLWFGAIWPAVGCLFGFDWLRIVNQIRMLTVMVWMASVRLCRSAWLGIANWFENQHWIRNPTLGEFLRVILLFGASLWLMRGFARHTLNGTPDALWYSRMLADMVAQVRSGVFPVWAGQSIFQFNGAIYPLRVAPAFVYLGALLDKVTLGTLGVFELQNLLLTLIAVGAMATAYLGLRALLPGKRWIAAGLAALFLSCPGVLGISYNTDLYMSWTTVPLVPLVWFATVRSFQDRGALRTLVLLGASLGCCWWGHSPIALWSTLIAGAVQAARICIQWRDGVSWSAAIAAVLVFGAVAAYPVGSVLLFPPEPGVAADSFQKASAGTIVYFLRVAFPATFLPLSPAGRSLADFQLGYSLWALLVLSIWSQRGTRKPNVAVALTAAAVLAVLLLPIPGVNLGIWSLVPSFVRNITGNWVMNRLYLLFAAATVFGAASCASAGLFDGRRRTWILALLILGGCIWSFSEAGKFASGSTKLANTVESAVDLLLPENIYITSYSYLVFPATPGRFTHGVADPSLENRLLERNSFRQIVSNTGAATAAGHLEAAGDFRPTPGGPLNYLDLNTAFHVEPSRSYLMDFDFPRPADTSGILQIHGAHFYREYALPDYGGPKAFGSGGDHANVLSVWSTAGAQDLSVRFVPSLPFSANQPVPSVAHVRLMSYDRDSLPVRVDSWIPYRAHIRSPSAAWLETPRMYQVGYRATLDRKAAEVCKSQEGLVCVAVPQGESNVELSYIAPAGLKLLFWLSFLAIIGTAFFETANWIRHCRVATLPQS